MCRGECYSFLWIAALTLDLYLIMLSVKQEGIKYHFLSLWCDSTWDWTPVSQAIGEHLASETRVQSQVESYQYIYIYIYIYIAELRLLQYLFSLIYRERENG